MDRRVTGDPDRLDAFTQDMLPLVDGVRDSVAAYRLALAAFNSARPNDLGTHIGDIGPLIEANLRLLEELDRAPAAFAFGLRNLDANPHGVRVGEQQWFETLVTTRLDDPDADVAEAAESLDATWKVPWEDGVGAWLTGSASSPGLWAGTPIGAALATVRQLDQRLVVHVSSYSRAGTQVAEHGRWRPGWADRMNRYARATTIKDAGGKAKWAGRALPFVGAGALQVHHDWGDESLTVGDNIARTSAAVAIEGGSAAGGAAIGAGIGTLVAPGVGTVIGGVVGGVLGGEAGSHVLDNVQGGVDRFGGWLDARFEDVADLGAGALDTMADVGGTIGDAAGSVGSALGDAAGSVGNVAGAAAESVGGWFGD